jgi:hypothetical protein
LVILHQVVGTEVRINLLAALAVLAAVAPDILHLRLVRVRLVKVTMVVRGTLLKILVVVEEGGKGLLALRELVPMEATAVLRLLQAFLAPALQLQAVVAVVGKVVLVMVVVEPLVLVILVLLLAAVRLQTLAQVVAVAGLAAALVAAAAPVLSSFAISISKVEHGSFC